MKNILLKIQWLWDLYICYFMYSPSKKIRYHRYMFIKWGDKYKNLKA
jgi:hypothetical protein